MDAVKKEKHFKFLCAKFHPCSAKNNQDMAKIWKADFYKKGKIEHANTPFLVCGPWTLSKLLKLGFQTNWHDLGSLQNF